MRCNEQFLGLYRRWYVMGLDRSVCNMLMGRSVTDSFPASVRYLARRDWQPGTLEFLELVLFHS